MEYARVFRPFQRAGGSKSSVSDRCLFCWLRMHTEKSPNQFPQHFPNRSVCKAVGCGLSAVPFDLFGSFGIRYVGHTVSIPQSVNNKL